MREETLLYIKQKSNLFIKNEPIYDMGGGNWQGYNLKSLIGDRELIVVDQFIHQTVSIVDNIHTLDSLKTESIFNIMSSDVIEHTDNPWKVIETFNRVMKPGGIMFITAPFIWHYHGHKNDNNEIVDLWRFTPLGLRRLCEKYFDIIECDWDTPPPTIPNSNLWRCGAHILCKKKNVQDNNLYTYTMTPSKDSGGW